MAKKKIISFLAIFISMIILDFLVISNLILPLYQNNLSSSLKSRPDIISSISAWFLIALGIVYFVNPHSKNKKQSFKRGAIFGLILYGVYDLTNYAIIQNWTFSMVILDIVWGIILCGTISLIGKMFTK